jgi:AcrR family transcriptional regulator
MTNADIIQAAFKAWGRELYRNTSLSQVSRELGVSKPALYRHFRNKQALLDAMYETFFDHYAASIKPYYEKAVNTAGDREAMAIITRGIMEYYARDSYAFIFSLINVYGNHRVGNMVEPLLKRGVDMLLLRHLGEGVPALLWVFVVTTLTFAMARFHRYGYPAGELPSDALIDRLISSVGQIVAGGLGFQPAATGGLDYESLEDLVAASIRQVEEDPLLRGVAEAVAEAGPWNASMGMVARHSGLSKSGLYAHFKSKLDMMTHLFLTEFGRIVDFAKENQRGSEMPEEQLYLSIFSVAVYLRSQPNILVAMDWLRTRRMSPSDLNVPPQTYRLFKDLHFPADYAMPPGDETDWISQWILFLILKVLMHGAREGSAEDGGIFFPKCPVGKDVPRLSREDFARIPNESFRVLYRFIVSGVKGFYR